MKICFKGDAMRMTLPFYGDLTPKRQNKMKAGLICKKRLMKLNAFALFALFMVVLPDLLMAQKDTDINGKDVVPKIILPGITQSDFQHAFDVLQGCVVTRLPVFGFTHPFMYPGGLYDKWWYSIDSIHVLGITLPGVPYFEKYWWEEDGSLALSGAKWANEKFAENVLRDFIAVQKPDGRIPLFSPDTLSLPNKVSSLPVLFEVGYTIARRTSDAALVRSTYYCLKRYLDWWLSYSVRRDSGTGLITGIFEESAPPDEGSAFTRIPVDLNSEVIIGCRNVASLARRLNDVRNCQKYSRLELELKELMNKHLWVDSAYYAFIIPDRQFEKRLLSNTFYPLEDNIAEGPQVTQLLNLLTDNRYFNWDQNPVTTVAKTDSTYSEEAGTYNGKQWVGDIWSMKNVAIIQGLEDVGRYDLSARLSYSTAMLFNNNCSEFIIPSSGLGQGQLDYAWSASQYIQIIIEKIFGVDYDGFNKTITIMPRLTKELWGHDLALDSLLLPGRNRLSVHISSDDSGEVRISYTILASHKNAMTVIVALPENGNIIYKASDARNHSLELMVLRKGYAQIFQRNNGRKVSGQVNFIATVARQNKGNASSLKRQIPN